MSPDAHEEGPPPPPLSAEDAEFRASFADLVDFYRVSQARVLWRAFWPGAFVLLPLGSVITALSVAPRAVPPNLAPYVAILGLGVTGLGPLWCIVQLLYALRHDDLYVAIRTRGLYVRLDPRAAVERLAWDEIDDVRYDAVVDTVFVHTARRTLQINARFADVRLEELARRLRDARRLAVWQRLSPKLGAR